MGFNIDSSECVLKLTDKKRINLIELLKLFLNKVSCRIIDFAHLLGKLVAACPAMEYGWLYTKFSEKQKLVNLEASNLNYKAKMIISDRVKVDLK